MKINLLLELGNSRCIRGLHEIAIALRASNFGAGAVVVALAVRCGRVLGKEFQFSEDVGGDCCRVGLEDSIRTGINLESKN